jgi:flagellar basal body rod protein FlgF
VTGCGTVRRTVTSEATDVRIQESKEVTARDSVVVELRDTLVETTTITIDRNEVGDTLKVVQVTDRTRARNRDGIAKQETKTIIKTDTVYVERRDSVAVKSRNYESTETRKSNFVTSLKWMLAIAFLLLTSVVLARARH